MGLAIVNHIVSEHNGTIRVEDNLPAGARFTVEIPVFLEPDEPKPAPESTPDPLPHPLVARP